MRNIMQCTGVRKVVRARGRTVGAFGYGSMEYRDNQSFDSQDPGY
jgi:hypothetical protein